MTTDDWPKKIVRILAARLKLRDDLSLKQRLLLDTRIVDSLLDASTDAPLQFISLACFLTSKGDTPSPYVDHLKSRLESMLSGTSEIPTQDAVLLGVALRTLSLVDAAQLDKILETASPEALLRSLRRSVSSPSVVSH